jgi:Phasin protein
MCITALKGVPMEIQGQPSVPKAASAFDVETMIEMTSPANEAVKMFNSKLAENASAYQKEWFGFFNLRWHENISLPMRLAACRSPMEAQQVYLDYWKRTFAQYQAEFTHLFELAQQKTMEAPEQGRGLSVGDGQSRARH